MSTEKIYKFIVNSAYEKLPDEAIKAAKKSILDCLGVTLAGGSEPGIRLITEYPKNEGAKSGAGIIGAGFRTVAAHAAWAKTALRAMLWIMTTLPKSLSVIPHQLSCLPFWLFERSLAFRAGIFYSHILQVLRRRLQLLRYV